MSVTQSLVPVNLSAADAHAAAGLHDSLELPVAPTADQLSNWSQEAYSLDVSAATSLGFPVGNFSTGIKRHALMFGSSRWKDVTLGGHTYRFGVALRAIIVVTDIRGEGTLTLPVVAAKVELEGARATAQLLVRGYKNTALVDTLPSWQSFGVDSYAEYMKAISNIQKTILADEAGIEPELLATTILAPALPAPDTAVGLVYALHEIAEGRGLSDAMDDLEDHVLNSNGTIATIIEATYRARIGDDKWAAPNEQQKEEARASLSGLHVSSHQILDRLRGQ